MGIKNLFKKEDNLTKELSMLPRDTRKRILDNVNRRRNEILEEKILEKQLKEYSSNNSVESKQGKWKVMKEGMKKRREELTKQGILKPLIRYDKKTFQSPMEEMSKKAREDEIKRLDNQRNKLKEGHRLGGNGEIKLKPLKLKSPETMKPPLGGGAFEFFKREKKKKKNGFI